MAVPLAFLSSISSGVKVSSQYSLLVLALLLMVAPQRCTGKDTLAHGIAVHGGFELNVHAGFSGSPTGPAASDTLPPKVMRPSSRLLMPLPWPLPGPGQCFESQLAGRKTVLHFHEVGAIPCACGGVAAEPPFTIPPPMPNPALITEGKMAMPWRL